MSARDGDPAQKAPGAARERILIVDDQFPNRDILGRHLASRGYDVVLREDACTIEQDVAAEKIDLVLLDWLMPHRSGLDALEGLRKRHSLERLPVIVVTAQEDRGVVSKALSAGANDYVTKPVDFSVLLARLRVQLDRRAAVLLLDANCRDLETTVRLRTRELSLANESLRAQISEREAAEERARAMALHDALTGLPNRRHLFAKLEGYLSVANAGGNLALVLLDLDRFKPVNDLYGHSVGDELLIKVAELLSEQTNSAGLAARLGGDEFVLALPYDSLSELIGRLSALVSRFDSSLQLLRHEVSVGVSMGVAIAPADGVEADTLMRRADVALYRAKKDGRGRFAFFEVGMDAHVQERATLEQDLRIAVRNDAIEPHFQPLVQLETGAVLGYEILARWLHPTRGFVQADYFIQLAEEAGLIGDLSLNVLRRACLRALHWPGAPQLSMNIAPSQLRDPALPQKVLKILTECGFPPTRLEIEVTENSLVSDFERARGILCSFKNLGMQIALDDFGTGYSSLRHLRELPFDVLKIDRSFVRDMGCSDEAKGIVKTIIDMAKNLQLHVTAEGIETADHASFLLGLGCDLGQGYYFGEPSAVAVNNASGCPSHEVHAAWELSRPPADPPAEGAPRAFGLGG